MYRFALKCRLHTSEVFDNYQMPIFTDANFQWKESKVFTLERLLYN